MPATTFTVLIFLATSSPLWAVPPDAELTQKVTAAIQKHCPGATCERTEREFIAKCRTMTYTLHRSAKTGEIFPETYQQEGPGYKGFVLRLSLEDGKYRGAAVVPQSIQGPYFQTYIDATPLDGEDKHLFVSFAYGSQLEPATLKAILEIVPRSTVRQIVGDDRWPFSDVYRGLEPLSEKEASQQAILRCEKEAQSQDNEVLLIGSRTGEPDYFCVLVRGRKGEQAVNYVVFVHRFNPKGTFLESTAAPLLPRPTAVDSVTKPIPR